MSFTQFNHIKISGVASSVPPKVESNEDYEWISEKERKLLMKTTGVYRRRVAENGVCASDLCFDAAEKLLHELNWERESVDVLLFVSQSPDYFLPATAGLLQNRLGLSKRCMSLDVNLGCSGYVYGMQVMSSLLESGQMKRGLLLTGDVSTNSTNYKDKSTYPLFGDGGTATAIEYSEKEYKSSFLLGGDGGGADAIILKGGGTRQPYTLNSFDEVEVSEGIVRNELNLVLEGLDVFTFAIQVVPKEIKELMQRVDFDLENVSGFIMHQANKLINETIRKKLKQPAEKFPESLSEFGNTSSASIPLTLCFRKEEVEGWSKTIFSGFGVGLSWGTVLTDLSNCLIVKNIEYNG